MVTRSISCTYVHEGSPISMGYAFIWSETPHYSHAFAIDYITKTYRRPSCSVSGSLCRSITSPMVSANLCGECCMQPGNRNICSEICQNEIKSLTHNPDGTTTPFLSHSSNTYIQKIIYKYTIL